MMTRGSVNVLGYRADILGTNCNKLLKLKFNGAGWWWGGGGGGDSRFQLHYVQLGRILLLPALLNVLGCWLTYQGQGETNA